MKKLDGYIIRKFIGTFVFIICALVAIAIVIDLTEKISNLVAKKVSFFDVAFGYYLYFIPYIGTLLGPFFVFIAVIFFTSQMADRCEFIAMLAAGVSYQRILRPYLITAFLLAALLFVSNNEILPRANKKRLLFENTYINRIRYNPNKDAHRQVSPDLFMYVENFSVKDSTASKFTLERIQNNRLTYKLKAEKMVWLREKDMWRLYTYTERTITKDREYVQFGPFKDTVLPVQPFKLFTSFTRNDEMTTSELNDKIQQMKETGAEGFVKYEIEKYRRTASAFSVFIFTVMGVSISSRKIRGGMGFHLIMGITLAAAYEVVMKTTTTFSINAGLPPMVGVWIPNIIYIGIAIFFYQRAQK